MAQALERQVKRPDEIFFLGDGLRDLEVFNARGIPVTSVRGNCDWSCWAESAETPEDRLIAIGTHRIFLTHGARYGVKSGVGALLSAAVSRGADIILFGHTHQPYLETVPAETQIAEGKTTRPVLLFNPGSIGYDEDGRGKSFGVLTIQGESVLLSHGRL